MAIALSTSIHMHISTFIHIRIRFTISFEYTMLVVLAIAPVSVYGLLPVIYELSTAHRSLPMTYCLLFTNYPLPTACHRRLTSVGGKGRGGAGRDRRREDRTGGDGRGEEKAG